MEWIAEDLGFLPIEIDLWSGNGIDVHGLRHEWDCFSQSLDPVPLASILRDRIVAAGRSGVVLSFPSTTIFTREKIEAARHVGIYTAILFDVGQHSIDSFLKREQTNGRGLDEEHWHLHNDHALAVYGGPDYIGCRFDAFCAKGFHRPRADIVNAIATWLDAEQSLAADSPVSGL